MAFNAIITLVNTIAVNESRTVSKHSIQVKYKRRIKKIEKKITVITANGIIIELVSILRNTYFCYIYLFRRSESRNRLDSHDNRKK